MQPVFDRTTPVVDFVETPSPRSWGPRRWILWPAYAYKVLIPSHGNPPFNVFQRAVLDMCQAGIRDPKEIAERLGFPSPDLFTSIVEQLQSMDALDSHCELTEHAKRLLADEADVPDVEDVGYVFVDAHSRHLWPRLHRGGLPLISADMDTGKMNIAELSRGDEGSIETIKATVLWSHASALPNEPSTYDVQKAVRLHTRRVRSFARELSKSGGSTREMNDLIAKKVRILGMDPELIFVVVAIFMPKDARQSSWSVTDPCGLGVSEVLRAGMAKLAKEDRHVKEMLERLTGQALHVDDGDLALYLADANRSAALRVAKHLGDAANALPTKVLEQLARADGKSQSKKTKDIETFYAAAYAAIEGTFSWLVSLYPDTSVLASLAPEALNNGPFLRLIAERLGFTTSEKTNAFFKTSRGVVKGALCDGNTKLPGCLAAALLAAKDSSKHPLATLAVKNQNALIFLANLQKPRNNASHYSAEEVLFVDAIKQRNALFKLFRDLLGCDTVEEVALVKEVSWGSDMFLRIRLQAVKGIEQTYPGIDEHPDLHSRMIEMREASLVVDMLTCTGTDGQELLETRLKQLMVDTTIVMEAIFAELEKQAPSLSSIAQDISDDRNQNAALLVKAASSLGFQLDTEGKLTQELTHTKPDFVRNATHGKVNSLQATVAAQVLSANEQQDHPLREIARKSPNFLLHLGQLVEARGHGDEDSVTAAEAQEIVKFIEDDIQVVLDVIF